MTVPSNAQNLKDNGNIVILDGSSAGDIWVMLSREERDCHREEEESDALKREGLLEKVRATVEVEK